MTAVRIDSLTDAYKQALQLDVFMSRDRAAISRLAVFLSERVEGHRLEELELLCENPPRAGMVEDEPGLAISFRNDHGEPPHRSRLFRLELIGRMAVFLSVNLNAKPQSQRARIEALCLPPMCDATERAVAQRLRDFRWE